MRLLVIGAGGHAKVVVDAARASGFEIAAVVGVPDGRAELLGLPVVGDASGVATDGFIVAIGDNAKRAKVFAQYRALGLTPLSVIHPSAVIADGVQVGGGTVVAAGAIINVDTVIGDDAIINTGCTIDHDCVIGAHALVGPGSSTCGGCHVGEGALVGVGASIAPTRTVGAWSVVGAGAAVVDDIPDRSVSVGVPARVIRTNAG
jgi:sugar O-acyltransferase (sialic acid O-acetyltransferase NeuD family)